MNNTNTTDPGANNPGANNPGVNNPGVNNPGVNNPGVNNPGANNSGANKMIIPDESTAEETTTTAEETTTTAEETTTTAGETTTTAGETTTTAGETTTTAEETTTPAEETTTPAEETTTPAEETTTTLQLVNEEAIMFNQGFLKPLSTGSNVNDYRSQTNHSNVPRAGKFKYKWDVVNLLMYLVDNNTGSNRQILKKILTSSFDNSDFLTQLNNAVIPDNLLNRTTRISINNFWRDYDTFMTSLTPLKAQLEEDQSIVIPTEEQMDGKHFLIRAGFIRHDPDPKTSAGGLYPFSSLSPNQHDEMGRRFRLNDILNSIIQGHTLISQDGNPMDLPAIKREAYTLIPECANPPSWWPENADIENRWVPFMRPNFYEDTEVIASDPEIRIQFVQLKELVDNDLPYTPSTTTLEETTTAEETTTTEQSGGRKKRNSLKKRGQKKRNSLKKRGQKKRNSLKKQSKKDLKKSRRASK